MFAEHDLADDVTELRDELVPDGLVLDVDREFETMDPEWGYELALITDSMDPVTYPEEWVPTSAPRALRRLTDGDLTIGQPGDGGVAWTTQTTPPLVFVKPRLEKVPTGFRDFLIAEALLQVALGVPEEPLAFFGEEYRSLQDAAGGEPKLAYGLAVALTEGWRGLVTRERFRAWETDYPRLHEHWADAGERLADRVADLPRLTANGRLGIADATELACSAIKHGLDLPKPYAALDVEAFREQRAAFAIQWVAQTIASAE